MTEPLAAPRSDRVAFGASMIVFAVFLMSLQDAIIKYASSAMPLWQIWTLRGFIALPALMAILRHGWLVPVGRWTWFRACLLVLMYLCLYAAVPITSLSTIAAGFYTGPLFIALLAAMLAGDRVSGREWAAVIIGFGGVLAILKPGSDAFTLFALLPVGSGFFYALAAVVTRFRCQAETPATMALALNVALVVTGIAASLAIALWQPNGPQVALYPFLLSPWTAIGPAEWALVAALAVLIVGIGLGLAAAYQCAPPVIVASFDYSYLIFAAIWSAVIFGEPPDLPTIAGMTMIAGAGLLAMRRPVHAGSSRT